MNMVKLWSLNEYLYMDAPMVQMPQYINHDWKTYAA